MKKITIFVVLICIGISFCACRGEEYEAPQTTEKYNHYEVDIYVSDSEKEAWYDAIVKLISNQQIPYGEHGEIMGYEAPRPNEPSIACGLDMGLFDITGDGVPELLLNLGGGSAGNDCFYIYDIFSGKHIGILGGGGDKAWNIYYDIQNDRYVPIGRYDLRSGDSGSSHHISTIQYSEEDQLYYGKALFYSSYEYDKIITEGEDGKIGSIELDIEDVDFMVNGEPIGFQSYHYELTDFYQEHSLVPHTGLMLYYWSDVSDDDDSYQERAEKMAQMLLFGSGQKFVKINN